MTKERELLELIAEYVQARAAVAAVPTGARSLEDIADEFGQVLNRDESLSNEEHIPPIVTREDEPIFTREDEMKRSTTTHDLG